MAEAVTPQIEPRGFVAGLRVVLRGQSYRRLLAGRLTSQTGDGVLNVALASYVFFSPERQATAAGAAVAFAVLLLPYSLIGPFAGIVLDRFPRRQVLLAAAVTRATVTGLLASLVAGGLGDGGFAVMVLTVVGLNRFFLAGQGASLPRVVPGDELVMANAVTPTLGTVAAMVGGVLAFGLARLVSAGQSPALALAAALFALAGLLTLRLDRDRLGPDPDEVAAQPPLGGAARTVVLGLLAALTHLRDRPAAARGLAVMAAHRAAFGFVSVTTIVLYRNVFLPGSAEAQVGAALAGLAVAFTASGVGFGLAAVLTPVATRRLPVRTWMVSLLLLGGAAVAIPAASLAQTTVALAAFLLGVSVQGVKICVDAIVQRWVDDGYRGRVFAIYDMLFNLAIVASAGVAAAVLPTGERLAEVAPAALAGVSVLLVVTAVVYRRREPSATLSLSPGVIG